MWLPRHSISQRDYCPIAVESNDVRAGDLVFTTGKKNYFWDNPDDSVGHVGIATGEGAVIHAANSKLDVIESDWDDFIKEPRGIKRMIPNEENVVTIEFPDGKIIEDSLQFRWTILQNCQV